VREGAAWERRRAPCTGKGRLRGRSSSRPGRRILLNRLLSNGRRARLAAALFAFILLAGPPAAAQDDPSGNAVVVADGKTWMDPAKLEKTVSESRNLARDAAKEIGKQLETSGWDPAEAKRLAGRARELKEILDEARKLLGRKERPAELKPLVGQALQAAAPVNVALLENSFERKLERTWNRLRHHLNLLAQYYGQQELPNLLWHPPEAGGGTARP